MNKYQDKNGWNYKNRNTKKILPFPRTIAKIEKIMELYNYKYKMFKIYKLFKILIKIF